MADKIRVLLVDDQRLMRDGLRILLELEPDIEVVADVDNGLQALDCYTQLQPDIVLMDVRMPGLDGVQVTRRLITQWPRARVIILTTFDDDVYIFEGLRAGALGYLLKDLSGHDLAQAVRTVMAGGALIEPSIARKVFAEFSRLARPPTGETLLEPLSDREQDVLHGIGQGLTNREIAQSLNLSEGTVKNYVTTIFQKLNVQDRTQAALYAQKHHL